MLIPKEVLQEYLERFLEEDIGQGDITTNALVPQATQIRAKIIVKEPAVVCGLLEAKVFFEMLGVNFTFKVQDGDEVFADTVVAEVEGDGRSILAAERTILNILMRMSGIATETRKLVKKVHKINSTIRIAATRKTAPGLRYFDKRAVAVGGGDTHRMRLDEAFLIKDNHIMITGGIHEAVRRARISQHSSKKIEVEAKTKKEAIQAAELGVDIVMFDNMSLKEAEETMKELTAKNLRKKVLIEISGGITKENITSYANIRPDIISLGSLTHSIKAVDMSLEVIEVKISQ